MNLRWIVLGVACLSGMAARADLPAESLPALEREALDHNPMVRAARAEAAAVAAQAWGASSPGEAMVEGSRTDGFGMRSTMLGARLNLPFPGSSILGGRAANLAARAAAERVRATELEVTGSIRTAFYRLAAADGALDAANQARDLFRQAAAVAKSRAVNPMRSPSGGGPAGAPGMGGGMGGGAPAATGDATADYLLLQAEAVRTETMAVMQTNERTVAEAELAGMLGRPRDRGTFGRAALPELPEPAFDTDRLIERARLRSPRLQAARRDADSAGADAGRMGLMTLPMLSPFYERERDEMGATGRTYGLALSYPLWFWKPAADWKQARAMRDAKRAEADGRELDTVRIIRMEASETRSHWRAATSYRDEVVPLLEQAVRSARSSYESGRSDVLQLLTAMREWLAARTTYHNEAYHYGEHRAILEWTVGESIEEVK